MRRLSGPPLTNAGFRDQRRKLFSGIRSRGPEGGNQRPEAKRTDAVFEFHIKTSLFLLLQSGSLERIPISRVDQRLGASVMRVGRGVDLAARADLGVAVVKRHYPPAKVVGWPDPFIV